MQSARSGTGVWRLLRFCQLSMFLVASIDFKLTSRSRQLKRLLNRIFVMKCTHNEALIGLDILASRAEAYRHIVE